MGTPLQVGALVARTLSLLHDIPLVGVNHCVGRTFLAPLTIRDAFLIPLNVCRYRDGPPDHILA